MQLYEVMIGGIPHIMQYSEKEAKRLGLKKVETKAVKPANKAVAPANKAEKK